MLQHMNYSAALNEQKNAVIDELKIKVELTGDVLSVLTKMSFVTGSDIFQVYCAQNGGFPDDISLAYSLRYLYVVAAVSAGTLIDYCFFHVTRHFILLPDLPPDRYIPNRAFARVDNS